MVYEKEGGGSDVFHVKRDKKEKEKIKEKLLFLINEAVEQPPQQTQKCRSL